MRYQIWNKTDEIYTPSGAHFTAQEWKDKYPWINIPGAKMIITTGLINGGAAMEWGATVALYKSQGANITDDMSDEQVLAAIEDFEDNPPVSDEPSSEERIAAALEAQVLMATPETEVATLSLDEDTTTSTTMRKAARAKVVSEPKPSVAYERVKQNYKRGLWSASLVQLAMSKGQITEDEMMSIFAEE